MALIKLGEVELQGEALGFPAAVIPTEAQVVQKVAGLIADRDMWKKRAEENLTKLETSQKVLRENEELRAENFLGKAKAQYKITAAEEVALKKMYMSGDDGRATVEELISARADNEYLTRVASLQNVKEAPVDIEAEVNGRASEEMAKDKALGITTTRSAAMARVLSDPKLKERWEARFVAGKTPAEGN